MYRLAILNSHPIQYFAPLYRRLAQEPEIDLTVFYCSRKGTEEYFDSGFGQRLKWDVQLLEGYPHRFLPGLMKSDHLGGFFSLINPSLIAELRRGRFDALLVHGHQFASYVLGIVAAKFLGIPVLIRCETHLLLHRSPLKMALRRPVMNFFHQHVYSACLPIGTRNREFYLHHGVKESNLFDVPYTVDNSYFIRAVEKYKEEKEAIRKDLGLPVDKPLILYASKLTKRKRAFDLLLSFQRLQEHQQLEATLLFVGAGEQEQALKDYAQEHSIPDVHFFGFYNQSELPKLFAISDIFVLPSENEPWGLIINEVMCAGLPVIATEETGATADLVKDGYNGFTYQAGDLARLTEHLSTLILDAGLRKRMGQHSKDLIAKWDYESCVSGILAALRHLHPSDYDTEEIFEQNRPTA